MRNGNDRAGFAWLFYFNIFGVMKKIIICFVMAMALACSQQKESRSVTKESLLKYGAENPETGVVIETDHGMIKLKLYKDTPLHRANFVKLIKEGHYEEGDF